jgi:hypothetical protein
MLIVFLQLQKQRKPFTQEKMIHFTDFLRTYKPLGFKDMEQRLQSLIKSCEKDLDGVRGRGFLDPHLKEMYADEIALEAAERGAEKKVTATYQEMIVKANELLQDAITLRELMPEAIQKIESKTSQTV